ncbi:MAG: hypothetical protein DSY42_08560 [Aquifex sp.]|nr:MAG: hypothetical protein DSY42_08560 [Aquifex sp.]
MGELHPPVVHFAIALSISGVLFEIFYLITKMPLFSSASLLNLLLAIPFAWASWFTGHQAEEAVEKFVEGTPAYELLEAHETLGLVVAVLITLLALLKLLAFFRNSKGFKIAVLILGIAVTVAVVLQGRIGGKMVYEYGVGVKPLMEVKE